MVYKNTYVKLNLRMLGIWEAAQFVFPLFLDACVRFIWRSFQDRRWKFLGTSISWRHSNERVCLFWFDVRGICYLDRILILRLIECHWVLCRVSWFALKAAYSCPASTSCTSWLVTEIWIQIRNKDDWFWLRALLHILNWTFFYNRARNTSTSIIFWIWSYVDGLLIS